jgi:putative flippase GtrA
MNNTLSVPRFLRSLAVGSAATVTDFTALVLLVEGFGLSAQNASIPALCAGAAVQFLGNRAVAFGATHGHWRRQLARFAVAELLALALNAWVFASLLRLGAPYPLARVIGSFGVFAGVSYPLWHVVFPPEDRAPRSA